jgi:plastocyanin
MVRIAASFIGAAVAFSSVVSAAPTVARRQGDLNVALPTPAAGGAEPGLDQINLNGVNTDVAVDPSLGNPSVQIPTATDSVPLPPPVETVAPQPQAPPPVAPPVSVPSWPQQQPGWPQYGSGSVNWHGDYNGCVEQCFVSHPAPPTVIQLPPSVGHGGVVVPPSNGEVIPPPSGQVIPPSGGEVVPPVGGGNGVEHKVILEAVSGALRFVPAFVTAQVGETIVFLNMNGAHSIVSSAAILPCNATGEFDSGVLQAGGTFTHVVKDTEPQFFFSGVNGDCQAGMFGAINAATGLEGSPTTVNSLMPTWAQQNPDIAAALSATNNLAVNTGGLNWGGKVDVSQIPPELHGQVAGNVLFTRAVMGSNPDMIDSNNVFRPEGELIVPNDILASFSAADAGGYDTPAESENKTNDQASLNANNGDGSNGAGSIISSRVAVAGVALLAAMFMF